MKVETPTLTPEDISRLAKEGLEARREIEDRAKAMTYPSGYAFQSDVQKLQKQISELEQRIKDLEANIWGLKIEAIRNSSF